MGNKITKGDSIFCTCGTSYFGLNARDGSLILNEVCPSCGKFVKPQTISEYAAQAQGYETKSTIAKKAINYKSKFAN